MTSNVVHNPIVGPRPEVSDDQVAYCLPPRQEGDKWFIDWAVRPKNQRELDRMNDAISVRIKAEAQRRILLICSDWRQRNITARSITLMDKGRSNWTAAELAEWDEGEAIWAKIQDIRAASNALELMNPTPDDWDVNELYWASPST